MRPEAGNIYVATGKIERALEFIDTVTAAENISPDVWSALSIGNTNTLFSLFQQVKKGTGRIKALSP